MRASVLLASGIVVMASATTVLDVIKADRDFSFYAAALTQARFSTVLSSSAEITVFAPNNAAVLNITRNELDYLYNIRNNKTLYNSLAFGATAAALPTSSFANGQVLPTLDGSFTHTVHVYGPEIQIDAATITSADRKADNGFVNKVDAFLLSPDFALPPLDIMTTLRDNSTLYSLTTTLEAVASGALNATFSGSRGPWAFFAPTDAAWAALPAATRTSLFSNPSLMQQALMAMALNNRLYAMEIRNGMSAESAEGTPLSFSRSATGAITVNGTASIESADIDCFNGVIQTVSAVILPQAVLAQL